VTRYRWVALGLGITAQAAFAALLTGLPALGPALSEEFGLSLSGFGLVLGSITAGATVSLIPWGLIADRLGERVALAVGLAGSGLALAASAAGGPVILAAALLVAGMLGSVANVASGRVVMGWFEFEQRGVAFGLRQAAVPLGGATAAFTLPALAARIDPRAGLLALAAGSLAASVACATWLRPASGGAFPSVGARATLRDRRIYRLATASGALVLAQVCVIGFVALFLARERGMSAVAAGSVLAIIQVLGMIGRVVTGRWSDRRGARIAPLRILAAAIAIAWLATPLAFGVPLPVLIPILVASGALSFSWNGLAFAAVAELAEPGRSGTAIAIQQTALFGTAALVSPLFGALVEATSWPLAFAVTALGPAAAWYLLRPLAGAERRTVGAGVDRGGTPI
jgi:sugar phosphate permease